MTVRRLASVLLFPLALAACAEPERRPPPPSDAALAPEQHAAAERLGVPVAFSNALGMRFVLVPAGRFTMDSPDDEEGSRCTETRHTVVLTRPFYIQATEVTNAQYRRMDATHDSGAFESRSLNGDTQPVVQVSWEDADAFAKWLSEQDSARTYALPSEAQWEYACRAGTTTTYWFGDVVPEDGRTANGLQIEAIRDLGLWGYSAWPQDDGFTASAPVASFWPNPWGLYDMAGNVKEWCGDRYAPFDDAPQTDPHGADTGMFRMLRGGSWLDGPEAFRSASRRHMYPDWEQPHFGLRLVSPLLEPRGE